MSESGDKIENEWQRADQTAQHMAMMAITFATSAWSVAYSAPAACFHALAIAQLWTTNDGLRW
jgi:hypothetical protein